MSRKNQEPLASPLLIHSSRPVCDNVQSEKLKLSARSVNTGYPIAQEAEQHGLAPLVFHHLTKSNAAIADPEMKKLRVQFFRKRDRNRILMKELENPRMHNTAIATLMGIVVGMQRANHPDTKQQVEKIKDAFANHPDPKIKRYAFAVEQMVEQEKRRIR